MTAPAPRPMRVRAAGHADLPLIRAWMRESPAAPSWSDEDLAGLVSSPPEPASSARRHRRAWLAEDIRRQPVGFAIAAGVCVDDAPAECELEFLFVAPQSRGLGVADTLLGQVLGWARELHAREIWLEVRPSNAPAIALYTRTGFAVTGVRPRYYADPPEDALLMRCAIAAPV